MRSEIPSAGRGYGWLARNRIQCQRAALWKGPAVKATLVLLILLSVALPAGRADDLLGGLAAPQEGRSMRATSSFREGPDGKYDPRAPLKGDRDEKSNWDNFRVAPGATHVLMDEKGPGVITHIWMTFLGPEPQGWARAAHPGSARATRRST